MNKYIHKLGLPVMILLAVMTSGLVASALPIQAKAHANPAGTNATSNNTNAANNANVAARSNGSANQNAAAANQVTNQGSVNGQMHLAAAQLKACQNRENAVNTIISRINTRTKNQLNLFGTIATRVENFYVQKGNTLSNYNQLVTDVNSAEALAYNDLATTNANSSFSCTSSNPKGMVTAFQGYLKTELSDLQNYRTAVKNLIVGVASVNGVTVSTSSQSTTQGGQ